MVQELRPLHVLIVDDHTLMRKLVGKHLSDLGIEKLETATDGAETLATLEAAQEKGKPFDMVLLDWHMPNMSGLELLQHCRSRNCYDNTAIVMLTGECEPDKVILALQEGATSYMMKPVSQEMFVKKIREVAHWIEQRRGVKNAAV
ncbi:MAG: response regulator [Anaerolineae bacterium]|nr:response regulator [Anaerolineae bacterium]